MSAAGSDEPTTIESIDADSLLLISESIGPHGALRLATACHNMRLQIMGSSAIWGMLHTQVYGEGSGAAQALLPLPSDAQCGPASCRELRSFRAVWAIRRELEALIKVIGPGVDISNPPPVDWPDGSVSPHGAIMVPTHPGLVDSGLPGAQHSVHMRAGPALDKHLEKALDRNEVPYDPALHGTPFGEVVVTPGFKLKVKKILHAVGPVPRYHVRRCSISLLRVTPCLRVTPSLPSRLRTALYTHTRVASHCTCAEDGGEARAHATNVPERIRHR